MARPRGGYGLDGKPVAGTTDVINQLNKPALVGWAGKLCIEAGFEAGRKGEMLPPRWNDVCYGKRDKAAADGTKAHDLFEEYLNGRYVTRTDESDGAWQAFENAKNWLRTTGMDFQVWPHEKPLVSEVYRFGGTPDAIAYQDGETYIADWKTGGIYAEHLLQMAAYRQLLEECEGAEVRGVHLVRFHREHGDFHHHHFAGDALDLAWPVFLNLLAIYEPMKRLKARVK